jgi:two-component system OmpR family sensor kinase
VRARSSLFLKILAAFWLTIVLAQVSNVLIVAAYTHGGRDVRDAIVAMKNERQRSAEVALKYGGRPALDQVVATWPKEARATVQVHQGPGGQTVTSASPPLNFWPLLLPLAVLFAASLLFSAALAANLARPVSRLRDGFRKLAKGDLGVRLTAGMGRRRDEIADLAQDFDAMAERLQQLIASRDRLLHDVSHELRSPLARMSVAVGLARKNGELPETALTRIETESRRLNEIVGDLLSLSRAESDAGVEEIYFDLGALLQVVCDDARFEAQPRGVEVRLELSPELADPDHAPLLRGAPQLLRRGIENVIRNALRFSPPGDAVTVRARVADGRFEIEVSDEGPGVPPALLETMFEPFVKGPAESRGVGLGLSIARRALAAHGGTLQAFNRESGGLLMRIGLPADG